MPKGASRKGSIQPPHAPSFVRRARTTTHDALRSASSFQAQPRILATHSPESFSKLSRDLASPDFARRWSSGGSSGHTWSWSLAAAALVAAAVDDNALAEGAVEGKGDYTDLEGVWKQDKESCESMAEFLEDGLGFPWFVSTLADNVQTTLKITFPKHGTCVIVDKTMFGRNETTVVLGGPE